jgi:hypothetical protein
VGEEELASAKGVEFESVLVALKLLGSGEWMKWEAVSMS